MKENKIEHITASKCLDLIKNGGLLVDVRDSYDTSGKQFGIKEVVIIHKSDFHKNFQTLPKDKELIIADSVGLKSKEIVLFLLENGYNKVYNLAGGIMDWEKFGYPVTRNRDEMMAGVCACQMKSKNSKINYK
jgi:rhodanese-related sulfurtransferase